MIQKRPAIKRKALMMINTSSAGLEETGAGLTAEKKGKGVEVALWNEAGNAAPRTTIL